MKRSGRTSEPGCESTYSRACAAGRRSRRRVDSISEQNNTLKYASRFLSPTAHIVSARIIRIMLRVRLSNKAHSPDGPRLAGGGESMTIPP